MKSERAGQKSVTAAADPPSVIFPKTEEGMAMRGKQFNLTEGTEGSIPINATATALDPTANMHCWYDLTWE